MANTLADRSLPRRLTSQRKKRRGIILLMVVSLLSLFLLMGVTFAILAIQYKTSADSQAQLERYGDPPMAEMEDAMGVLLYDALGLSSLRGHSLLRDFYGTDSVRSSVLNTNVNESNRKSAQNHFVVFSINNATSGTLSNLPGYYNGRVITFITGAARNLSSRIAGYEPNEANSGTKELYIEPLLGQDGYSVSPANGDEFVINGAPFNGMGFGYDPATYRLDAIDDTSTNNPVVLLPHYAGYASQQVYSTGSGNTAIAPDVGGADEPWDAADLQNLALAVVPPGLLASQVTGNANAFNVPLIPSFHRPELVNYYLQSANWPFMGGVQLTQQNQKDLARKIIFRPMPWDHPNFTGSNPDLTAGGTTDAAYLTLIQRMAQQNATGSTPQWDAIWDVDNDGDGVRDSIWVDIGMPAVTDKSGRRYKRLFAFLVKDLDGRINLNVHGNLGQTNFNASTAINYPFPVFGTGATSAINFPLGKTAAGMPTASLQLPRGMGFGPAEVDFRYVLNQASLAGQYNTIIQSRYGNDNQPGQANTDDSWSVVKMNGVPANFHLQNSWYGSLPDVWGRNAVAVDFGGRPFFYREQNNASTTETSDDPYEMEWDYRTAKDSNGDGYLDDTPYTPGDMERLARIHDNYIGGFPQRLPTVAPSLFNGAGQPALNNGAYQRLRESLTTMSNSAPVVPGILRYQDRVNMTQTDSSSVLELYRQRLATNGITGTQQVRAMLAQIMPWEFWQGVPLDLNRYLHNGLDDNSNSANGDPAEALAAAGETAWGTNGSVPSGGNLPASFSGKRGFHANSIDADGDGAQDGVSAATNDRYWGRQLLARHLYCLVLALKDQSYNPQTITNGGGTNELTTRMIAQWAVNVVDFRDTDGIMTGFEYDINPFDGWGVDGNLNTTNDGNDRRVVWGMEAPDCLLTEVHAMHDRRVKDTKHDPTGKDRDDMTMRDNDLDQFRVPQGSLFLELFCPRMHGTYNRTVSGANEAYYNPHMPFELYDSSGRLDLARTPSGSPYPVWQIAIAKLKNQNKEQGLPTAARVQNQNDWQSTYYADPPVPAITGQARHNILYDINNNASSIEIERYIWFTNNDPPATKRNNVFYNRLSWPALLAPGQYMVVGPRQTTYVGSNKTDQGNSVGYWFNNSAQRIDLTQTTLTISNAAGTNTSKDPTSEIQPVVGMVAMTRPPDTWTNKGGNQWWVGANITEPLPNSGNYYPEYNVDETMTWNPLDAYDSTTAPGNTLPDAPLDNTRLLGTENMLESNIYNNVSGVFLQRLADPTQPWNALSNPYITVDFAPVDATVFSGEEDSMRRVRENPADANNMNTVPIDPDDGPPGNDRIAAGGNRFATGQRGVTEGSLWFPLYTQTELNPAPGRAGSRYMPLSLNHTLGYINEALGSPRDAASSGNYFAYVGDPTNTDKAFPWVTWNNRPFMNAAELLNVPMSAPNRLVLEVSPQNPMLPTVASNPYQAITGVEFRRPFLHLLNMFQSTSSTTNTPSMNLARLFDYVEVPSNFSHTERWYNPNLIANTDGTPPAMGTLRPEYAPPYLYRPPFNKLSRFRDPGKININTIYDPAIWYALIGYDPTTGGNPLSALRTPANELFQSRQGYNGTVGQMNNNYPTIFANPFRPADTADLMPNVNNMRTRSPAEVGLYRPSSSRSGEPLLGYQSSSPQIETDRHPYFKHQGLQKLASNVTTQSNCFAVWVTVGYFECEDCPTGIDAAHPDGYQLGQELNVDTSRVQRHRSFFLIDRTIPAGFIPGLKLNTDNCVLLRRQID